MTATARLQDALAILCATYLVLVQTNLALALRSMVFGLIALVALVLVLRPDARGEAALSRPACALALAFVAWAGWSMASLAWSSAPLYSAGELKTDVLELGVAAGAVLLSMRETLVFRRYVATILAAFAVLALGTVVLSLAPGPWDDKLMHHGVGTWSTHLVLVAPLVLLVRASPRVGWGDGPVATGVAVALLVLLLASARATENRMVWLALLAALAVLGIGGALRWPRPWRERGGMRALAIVLLALVLASAFAEVALRKAEATQSPPASIERSVADDPRLLIWPLVRDRIAEHPWIGHGFGKEILGSELSRALGDATLTHAHNAFASVWLQTGAIGLALFVAVLAAAAWRFAGYARSRDDALALVGIVGLAILAGVVVKNLTDDFFVRTNARFLWAVVALLVAFGERRLGGVRDDTRGTRCA
ncbi:MAG: O-antigen ligase family protein [Betaproteobacteria bacterium]